MEYDDIWGGGQSSVVIGGEMVGTVQSVSFRMKLNVRS